MANSKKKVVPFDFSDECDKMFARLGELAKTVSAARKAVQKTAENCLKAPNGDAWGVELATNVALYNLARDEYGDVATAYDYMNNFQGGMGEDDFTEFMSVFGALYA